MNIYKIYACRIQNNPANEFEPLGNTKFFLVEAKNKKEAVHEAVFRSVYSPLFGTIYNKHGVFAVRI